MTKSSFIKKSNLSLLGDFLENYAFSVKKDNTNHPLMYLLWCVRVPGFIVQEIKTASF